LIFKENINTNKNGNDWNLLKIRRKKKNAD